MHFEDSDARLAASNGDVVETVWTTLITFGDTCGTPTTTSAVPERFLPLREAVRDLEMDCRAKLLPRSSPGVPCVDF